MKKKLKSIISVFEKSVSYSNIKPLHLALFIKWRNDGKNEVEISNLARKKGFVVLWYSLL